MIRLEGRRTADPMRGGEIRVYLYKGGQHEAFTSLSLREYSALRAAVMSKSPTDVENDVLRVDSRKQELLAQRERIDRELRQIEYGTCAR